MSRINIFVKMKKATYLFILLLGRYIIIPLAITEYHVDFSIPSTGIIQYSRTHQGINVHGQDIQRWDLPEPSLTLADFQRIRSWGLNTVQFFIQWNLIEPNMGEYDEEFLQKLDLVMDYASQAGLNIVLKIHISKWAAKNGGWIDFKWLWTDADFRERFYSLWEMLVLRYKDNQDISAWALLNEPVPDSTSNGNWTEAETQLVYDNWNMGIISDACIERVRAIDNRPIMITYGIWGSPTNYADFGPRPYENIIYVFSWYKPMDVTHYGAEWTGDKQTLLSLGIQTAIDFRDSNDVAILVQEIGIQVQTYGYNESRLNWIDESLQVLNENDIGWFYYVYSQWQNLSFSVIDESNNELPTVDIIKANIPQ